MSSINQLVSEVAHSLGQPNNHTLRNNIKAIIVHTRNELIRHSYEQHNYIDKVLNYRYRVSLTTVNDGDIQLPDGVDIDKVKRTTQKVPRPVRLTNNLPFMRVSTVGYKSSITIPFVKETSAQFAASLPGMSGLPTYDYINDYIYVFNTGIRFNNLGYIVIEAPFENPTQVQELAGDTVEYNALFGDDDEWFLPEDMVGQIKDIIYKRELLNQMRETNEITGKELVK